MRPNFAIKAWRQLIERCAPWLARRKGSETVNEAKGSASGSGSTAPRDLTPDPVAGDNERDRETSRVATVETFAGARLVEFRRLTGTDRSQHWRKFTSKHARRDIARW